MVFSSFPAYPDPSNWQQQPTTTSTVGITGSSQLLPPPPLPPPQQQQPPLPPPIPHGGGSGSVRPGSMAERARLANVPMPEAALKCPRCESTNTKFCYFNNYSLSQPRHFCKTCRRYWTRGGALRNVPVGGGCRRNKRTKGSSSSSNSNSGSAASSKSQDSNTSSNAASTEHHQYHHRAVGASPIGPPSSLSSLLASYNAGLIAGHDHHMLGLGSSLPSLKLMAPNLHDFTNTENFGLQYGAVSAPLGTAFHIDGGSGGGGGCGGASGLLSGLDQWRFPATQLPLLGGLEISSPSSSSGLYPFDQTGMEQQPGYGISGSGQFGAKNIFHPSSSSSSSSSAMVTAAASQLASVKVEDNPADQLNLSRQLLGNDQLWNATATAATAASSWSDVSNFSTSSTSNNPI